MPVAAQTETPTDSRPERPARTPDWDGDARRLFWMAFHSCLWYMRWPAAVVLGLYALRLLLALVSKGTVDFVGGFSGLLVVLLAYSLSGATTSAFEPPTAGARQPGAPSLLMSLRPISRRRTWAAVTFGPLLATLLVCAVCMTLPYALYLVVWPDVGYGEWAFGHDWWWTFVSDTGGNGAAPGTEPPRDAVCRAGWVALSWLLLLSLSVLALGLLLNWLGQFNRELTFQRLRAWSILLLPLPFVALAAWSLWWLTTGISDTLGMTDLLHYGPWWLIPPAVGMIVIALSASRAAYASAPLFEERKRAFAGLWAMAKAWAVCAGVLVLTYGLVLMLPDTGQVG